MSAKIRLKRMGSKKKPFYRLVVTDSRSPRDGRFIECIGFYDPRHDPAIVNIDIDKASEWLRKGAVPSDTVRSLMRRQKIVQSLVEPKIGSKAETIEVGSVESPLSFETLPPEPTLTEESETSTLEDEKTRE